MAKPISQPRRPDQGGKMTYEEFLAWADEDTRAEWVDGDVVMNTPVSLRHEQITNFLIDVLSSTRGCTCSARSSVARSR